MKQLTYIALVVILGGTIFGCGSGNKSKQIKDYKYTEEKAVVNDTIQKKVGSWLSEGMTCYGIIVMMNKKGRATKVKEIEAKVVSIQPDLIKMKAMEELLMAPVQGCDKVAMRPGDTWEEKEGDLFRTREEAVKFIEAKYPHAQ